MKKNRYKRLVSIVICFAMILGMFPIKTVLANDVNQELVNPSFEMELIDGQIPGWSQDPMTEGKIELSDGQAKSGLQSLYLYDSDNDTTSPGLRALSNKIAVTPGETYISKASIYVVQQSHSILHEVQYFDAEGKEIGPRQQVLNKKGELGINEWIEIENISLAPEGAVYAKIGFYSGKPNVTEAYFDDVAFELQKPIEEPPLEPPAEDDVNQELVNPSFEMELVDEQIPGWSLGNGTEGQFEINTEVIHSGKNSLYFNDSSDIAGLRIISDKISVKPGESIIAKGFVNVIKQTHNIVYQLYYYNSENIEVGVKQELFGTLALGTNTWSEMRVFSEVPAEAAYARIALYSGNPSLTEAYFDDLSVERVSADVPLDREYQKPVDLGPMVSVNLGQAGAIQENALGENEVYFHTNGLPGRFYALDAETGKLKFTELVPNSEALWAMAVGSDKNLYFAGTADGKLYRYLPTEKKVEDLGTNPSDGWVWDLEATADGKIYGGTYAPDKTDGKVFEYDIETGKFRDYGSIKKGQDYVRGIAVDDQYIYAGLGTNVHLFKIDRITGEKTEIIIPENAHGLSTGDTGTIADVFIINNKLFVSVSTINMVVMDVETQEVLHTFQYSNMISEPSPYNPNLIYYKFGTKFYQYDMSTNQSSEINISIPLPDTVRVKDMQWIELKSGEKAGKKVLAMVTQYGEYILYDPTDQWLSFIELEIEPAPVRIQAIKTGMDGRIYLGGYQRGMSIYNPFTNKVDLNISSFPQPEGIGFLNDMAYYGTYVGAVMYRFDPTKPVLLNQNPEMVYDIKNEQDRPFAITSGNNKVFVGTVPDYGVLGGTLAIYDEATDTWSQYNNVVEDQSIIGLAYKDGLLYGSTTVWGGLGSEPTAKQAKIFIWDVDKNIKVDEFTLDIPGIDEVPRMIGEIAFGPDGLLWGIVDGTIFAINVDTKEIVKSKLIYPSLYNTSKWKAYDLRWSPDGMIYTTLSRKILVIDPETLQYKVIESGFVNDMTLGMDGSIYYAPEAGTTIARIAVPETDATLSAIYLDEVLLKDFSPGKLTYHVAVEEVKTVKATTTQSKAIATVIQEGSFTQPTVIQVVGSDGKSKLEYTIHWEKAQGGKLFISTSPTISVGSELQVALKVENAADLYSIEAIIHYDPTTLQIQDIQPSEVFKNGNEVFLKYTDEPMGTIHMIVSQLGEHTVNGNIEIANVVFKASDKEGNTKLTLDKSSLTARIDADETGTIYPLEEEQELTIMLLEEYEDVNKDGKIDILDFITVAKKIGVPVTDENRNLDINGDGKIDIADLGLIALKILA